MEINLDDFKKVPMHNKVRHEMIHFKGGDPEEEMDPNFISDCWSDYELRIMRGKKRKCVCSICLEAYMLDGYEHYRNCFKMNPSIEEERYVFICKICNVEGWRDILGRKRGKRVKVGIMGMNTQEF